MNEIQILGVGIDTPGKKNKSELLVKAFQINFCKKCSSSFFWNLKRVPNDPRLDLYLIPYYLLDQKCHHGWFWQKPKNLFKSVYA